MNYELLANGYPATTIKANNKEQYFNTLEEFSLTGNIKPFRDLLYNNIEKQLDAFLQMYGVHIKIEDVKQNSVKIADFAKKYMPRDKDKQNTR